MTLSKRPLWRLFVSAALITFALFLLLFAYYRFWFLRQPDRQTPLDDTVFVSPANGEVAAVVSWDSSSLALNKDWGVVELLTDDVAASGTLISVEMDVTNVHYQRAPIRSRFLGAVYREGAFRNALIRNNKFGFRLENEHNAMLFETPGGLRYKVVQIAGLVARRIVDYVEPQQELKQGEVIGLIKLGSQVTLILPPEVEPQVKAGDKVVDGETVVGRIK